MAMTVGPGLGVGKPGEPETAAVLQISPGSVKRQWRLARAWLYREMRKE